MELCQVSGVCDHSEGSSWFKVLLQTLPDLRGLRPTDCCTSDVSEPETEGLLRTRRYTIQHGAHWEPRRGDYVEALMRRPRGSIHENG